MNASFSEESEAARKLGLGAESRFVRDVGPRSVIGEATGLRRRESYLPQRRVGMSAIASIDAKLREEVVQSDLQSDNLRMGGADLGGAPKAARSFNIDQ